MTQQERAAILTQFDSDLEQAIGENVAQEWNAGNIVTFNCETCGVEAVNNYEGECAVCFTA